MSKNPKKRWKLMKTTSIDRKRLHIFWTTWGISMKFSEKMWLTVILKITRKQGFALSFFTFFEKPQGGAQPF